MKSSWALRSCWLAVGLFCAPAFAGSVPSNGQQKPPTPGQAQTPAQPTAPSASKAPAPPRTNSGSTGVIVSAPFIRKTLLHVGVAPGCNAGEVTTNELHLNCSTRIVGYTIDYESLRARPEGLGMFVEIFVGMTPGSNQGSVTNNINLRGATVSIGYLAKNPMPAGVALFETDGCQGWQGWLSTNPAHMGCGTRLVGYALPR